MPDRACNIRGISGFPAGERQMRFAPYIVAAGVAASPAAAQQGWKTYKLSAYSVSIAFPADPTSEMTEYHALDGRTVEARVYSVTGARSVLRMTVVELSGAPVEDTSAIEHAVAALAQGNEIKLDIPHHIGAVLGRQLSINRADGAHSFAAVFYRKWRLYQIEGIALSGDQSAMADAIRFQQSIEFQQSLEFADKASRREFDSRAQ
jgi:hypothetical protein